MTENTKPLSREERLELARKAYKEFYAQCFWSYREDLEVTEETLPFIIRGIRKFGGHRGYRTAAFICQ